MIKAEYDLASKAILDNLEYFETQKKIFSNKSSKKILNIIDNFSF